MIKQANTFRSVWHHNRVLFLNIIQFQFVHNTSFVQIVNVDNYLIISWIFTYINSLLARRLNLRLYYAVIENIKDFIIHNATLTRLRWSPASRLVQIKADVMAQRGHWGHSLALTLILLTNQSPVVKRDVKAAMFVHYVLCYDTNGFPLCSLSNSISF